MADLKRPLDQRALDALTLSTQSAPTAYQEERVALEVGRAIRRGHRPADRTEMQLAAGAGIDQGDVSRFEAGQGVRAGAGAAKTEKSAARVTNRARRAESSEYDPQGEKDTDER